MRLPDLRVREDGARRGHRTAKVLPIPCLWSPELPQLPWPNFEQGVSNAIHLVLKCLCCRDNLRLDDLRNRCLIILIGLQRALLSLNRTQMFEEGFSRPGGF